MGCSLASGRVAWLRLRRWGPTEITWDGAAETLLHDLAAGRIRLSARSYFDVGRRWEARARVSGEARRLTALDALDLQPYEHQRRAVFRVVRQLRGRAILADEVGLGKTIEAGLILREYWLRGVVRSALVLVPATLVWQWRDELVHALKLPVHEASGKSSDWTANQIVVASLDTAKRPVHRSVIADQRWDIVIVDEAHRLKNRATLNWKFVNSIPKLNCLLLTATPIQNDLSELYNLVTLLKPGQLRTYAGFKREFTWDKRSPKNLPRLRGLVNEVMVRTTRQESKIPAPSRRVHRLDVTMGEKEEALYTQLLGTIRRLIPRLPKQNRNVLPFIVLMREACSSPQAAFMTMQKLQSGTDSSWGAHFKEEWADLAEQARRIEFPSKFEKVRELVSGTDERYVLFTEYRGTLEMVARGLQQLGLSVIRFHGEMRADEKEAAVRAFERNVGGPHVMVSTDAGAEGRNLQFCRCVINYDLPWNPMRIEQRIGRVHRIGQRRTVHIWNCVTENTIEEALLNVLEQKVGLFRAVIGELDVILSELPDGFETSFAQAVLHVPDDAGMHDRISRLGQQLDQIRDVYRRVQSRNEQLLGPHGAQVIARE